MVSAPAYLRLADEIVIRADASTQIDAGHLMRGLTLAGWRDRRLEPR